MLFRMRHNILGLWRKPDFSVQKVQTLIYSPDGRSFTFVADRCSKLPDFFKFRRGLEKTSIINFYCWTILQPLLQQNDYLKCHTSKVYYFERFAFVNSFHHRNTCVPTEQTSWAQFERDLCVPITDCHQHGRIFLVYSAHNRSDYGSSGYLLLNHQASKKDGLNI